MQTVPLADTGRQTTHLGFGCSTLMGATGRRDSLRLLETAYDAGIRHFDVAPIYGYGEAETCLGEFLQRHRSDITVATKFGIASPKNSTLIKTGRRIASPILKKIPGLKKSLAHAANAATRNHARPAFTAAEAKATLHRSLATLRTDRIDLWLLHEAEAGDLNDPNLLDLLQSELQHGTIGSFGIGSSAEKIPTLLAERPAYCRTLQHEWSILDDILNYPTSDAAIRPIPPFRIHHRALTYNLRALHATLVCNKPLCKRWSESINTDLSQPQALASLMLKAALVMNPSSIVLFSSKNPQHIRANAQIAADTTLEAKGRRLYHLVQSERAQLAPNL